MKDEEKLLKHKLILKLKIALKEQDPEKVKSSGEELRLFLENEKLSKFTKP